MTPHEVAAAVDVGLADKHDIASLAGIRSGMPASVGSLTVRDQLPKLSATMFSVRP